MNRAFVLGNGRSRMNIDLNKIHQHGKIYGCNALYREFVPDYLIAVDTKMITEIVREKFHLDNEVWTNRRKTTELHNGINFFNKTRGWSSGPTALDFASTHGFDEIYILGFDYSGIKDNRVNNVYTGTENYKKINDPATFFGNWVNQTNMCIKLNPGIRYIRVLARDQEFIPDQLKGIENLKHEFIEEFKEKFEN